MSVILLMAGLVFVGQGSGYFAHPAESFMINQTRWVYYGAAIAVAGLLFGVVARRYWNRSLANAADKLQGRYKCGYKQTEGMPIEIQQIMLLREEGNFLMLPSLSPTLPIPHSTIGIAVLFVLLVLSHVSSNPRPRPSVESGPGYSTIGHRLIAETPRPSLGNVVRP